ncbi:MFS general substrate transporter [Penicillium verhagenii]|uniref:MFS general substrate transporter n=1 Tax=Penicillium verhagenii TaxID=1562060 RepID=UPI002545003E|nr:MFS general substrate transporter [Penicillium verhagenii]KAJ5921345.1 MFS general substrate transporter [Penicillium verhagenii]
MYLPRRAGKPIHFFSYLPSRSKTDFAFTKDFNMIATAVPAITSDFHSLGDVGWYGGGFFIALCTTQPLAGKAYTLFPKKIVYLSSLALFEVGSLVGALAPSSPCLIAGRAIAGFGASGIFAGGLVILTTVIPIYKRAVWIGTLNSTFAVAAIVGPVVGGALTQHVTWRWCFWINLPIGGFSAIVVLIFFHVKAAVSEKIPLVSKLRSLDLVGFILFASAVAMLLLALQLGGTANYAWNSANIIGLFVGAGIVLCVFVPWQLYMKDTALLPPRLFASSRNVSLICVSAFFSNGAFQCVIYWLPIWFQAVLGVSPTSSGVRYLPTVISDVLTSLISAGLVTTFGIWNPFLIFGTMMTSIGGGLLSTLYPTISEGHWIGYQILGGIGYSLIVTIGHLGTQASLPAELVPLGATSLLFMISASCAIFLAIGDAIFEAQLRKHLNGVVSATLVEEVISTGATHVRSVIPDESLSVVIAAYSKAVTQVFYLTAAAPVISFMFIVWTKWTSVKKPEAKEKKDAPDLV